MFEPTELATALALAGVYAQQAVRAGLRPFVPRHSCGRFVSAAGVCARCDGEVAA